MPALVLHEIKQPLVLEQRGDLRPGTGEVIVQVQAAALNRRDYWITQGMYPGITTPAILGSDGAGVVARVGQGVAADLVGQEVIVNPGWHWGDNPKAQGHRFRILGMPDDGTFASEVRVPVETVHARPSYLTWHQAAALPLGGLTAYRAVMVQGGLQAGQTVLIHGVGGGVATFALQLAVAAGAKVLVSSSATWKIDRAVQLGALTGYDYTEADWHKSLRRDHGLIDLIIDSAGGDGYANLIELAAPGGTIVNYGATAGPPKSLDLFKVFWKQLHLVGSTMGSPDDFQQMLEFVNGNRIVPQVDEVFSLAEGNTALERMGHGKQFGKIVLVVDQQ